MNNAWLQLLAAQLAEAGEPPVVPPDVRGRQAISVGPPNILNQGRVLLPGDSTLYFDNPEGSYEVNGNTYQLPGDATVDARSSSQALKRPTTERRVVPHVPSDGPPPPRAGKRIIRQGGVFLEVPEDAPVNLNGQPVKNPPRDIDLDTWLRLMLPERRK